MLISYRNHKVLCTDKQVEELATIELEQDKLISKYTSTKAQQLYDNLSAQIKNLAFGTEDKEINEYLKQSKLKFNTPDKANEVLAEMQHMIKGLKSPANNEIRAIIKGFDSKSNQWWWFIGAGSKARRIEEAMAKVPINERGNLLKSDHQSIKDLYGALDSHRVAFTKPTSNDNPNKEEKYAKTFKDFKKKFHIEISNKKDTKIDAENTNTTIINSSCSF